MKIVLHNYWRSSASHRVRIALALKGLDYEYVAVNITKAAQHADDYRAKNPSGQVPTLELVEDDGTSWMLTQSMPILEYLDERWPQPSLFPSRAGDTNASSWLRARSRALAEIINSGVQPLQNLSTTNAVQKLGGEVGAWVKPFIASGLAAYAQLVDDTWKRTSRGTFSIGATPTIADCCLVPQLASARRFGVDYAQHEQLVAIEQRCLALPAFAKAAPEQQPDAVRA